VWLPVQRSEVAESAGGGTGEANGDGGERPNATSLRSPVKPVAMKYAGAGRLYYS
jgi:hypothetical protein